MERSKDLHEITENATRSLVLAIKAVVVVVLALGLVVDLSSMGSGYLDAHQAARASAELGAALVEQGVEGPLGGFLLKCVQAQGAGLVSYRLLYSDDEVDRVWVQVRKIVPLYFLAVFGIERATLIASSKVPVGGSYSGACSLSPVLLHPPSSRPPA